MDQSAAFYIALLGAFATVVSAICDVLSVRRGKTVDSQDSLAPRRSYKVMALFLLLTWGAVGFDYYDRHTIPKWGEKPLIIRQNLTYQGETVPLDGYAYINCTFDDVTFEYNGTAPSSFTGKIVIRGVGSRFVGIKSNNPVVKQVQDIVNTIRSVEGVTFSVEKEERKE